MRRDVFFSTPCWGTGNDVSKRLPMRNTAKSTSSPFSQIFCDGTVERFAKDAPRLPARSRHNRDTLKVFFGSFGSVAASKCLDQANDFAAFFESRFHKGVKGHRRN